MWNAILCKYAELALKGGNRKRFEKTLIRNIRRLLHELPDLQVSRERGRIVLGMPEQRAFAAEELDLLKQRLPKAFGLSSWAPGVIVERDMATLEQTVKTVFPAIYAEYEAEKPRGSIRFRVTGRRSDKSFPLESIAIGRHFADLVLPDFPRLEVDLKHAELDLHVEVRSRWGMVYCREYPGPGGLPSGTANPGLALLSGGIDSPVACYQTMRRGSRLNFLTFHSYPYTPPEGIGKVARLVNMLNDYQRPGRYFACNLVEAQKIIRDTSIEGFRTILYRRLMMRVARTIAEAYHLSFLVTGESIGQVASQTIPNLVAIDEAADMLVVRPLACFDKQEAVDIARRIGTMAVSTEECADSCTVFAPRQPETGVKLDRLHRDEEKLDTDELLNLALAETYRIDPDTLDEEPWDAQLRK